jgi:hypothetical protein
MAKRRLLSGFLFGGILLATGVAPAGAAPAPSASAALLGPNHGLCFGGSGTDSFGTATLQGARAKAPADHRSLRVDVVADNVMARRTYEVRLTATVVEPIPGGYAVGCRLWSAGTTVSSAGGMIRFTGIVVVPDNIPGFQVHLGSTGTPGAGYSATIGVP